MKSELEKLGTKAVFLKGDVADFAFAKESVAKAKEAEEEEKKMKEEEHKSKKGGNSGQRPKSAGQVIDRIKSLNAGGISDEDDLAEALGIDD